MPDGNGGHRLSVIRKARILRNNLFGVDIDPQAVEITMMSLYLKALEGEKSQLPPKQSLLPELKYNVICGNSLIGPDIYDQGTLFADEERDRINAFDWDSVGAGLKPAPTSGNAPPTFGHIMRSGGFHCVIGNPPYVRQESISEFKDYFQTHYESFDGVADLYVYFMEKGLRLVRDGGYYSIIVSSSFLRTSFAGGIRAFLKKAAAVVRIVDFGGLAVFENAKDTYVCVPLLAKQKQPERVQVAKITSLGFEDLEACLGPGLYTIPHQRLTPEAWSLKTDAETAVFEKMANAGTPFGEYVQNKFYRGLLTGLNEAFEITAEERERIIDGSPSSQTLIKPFVGGQDIRRYHIENVQRYLVVVPCGWTKGEMLKASKPPRALSEKDAWVSFSDKYPGIAEHLQPFAEACRKRQDKGDYWWELRPCDYYQYFEAPKIIFPDICKGPRFYLDSLGLYLANTAYCIGRDDKYLLGILNSRVFWFAISNISIPFGIRAGEYRYRLIYQYMEEVPIRAINFSDPADKARHDRMVALVERMLELSKKKHSGKLAPSELDRLDREIAATDEEIDELVYALYGITQDERRIIEAGQIQRSQ